MSNFLLNLALRGAGLAPAVRARAEPALQSGDSASAEPDAGAVTVPPIAPALARTEPRSPPPAMLSAAQSLPQGPPARVAPIASAPYPVVQRLVTPEPAAPSVAMPTTAARSEIQSVPPASAPSRAADRATAVTPSFEMVATPEIATSVQPVTPASPVVEAAVPRDAPAREHTTDLRLLVMPATEHVIEHLREETRIVARLPEPATADGDALQIVSLEPAPVAIANAPPPELAVLQERVVQVRIGALEIHAAAAAQPAPAQTAAAVPPPAQQGGFESYARLRSYAPWQW